jgi:hypothetical protein
MIDAIEFYKSPHFMGDTLIENMHEHVDISYKNEDGWQSLTAFKKDAEAHPAFEKIIFDPVGTNELRLINKLVECQFSYYS